MGFKSFISASKTIQGIEAINMIRKGQVNYNKSVLFEVEFINQLFGIAS
jgi:transposase, IS6 family